MHEFSKNFRQWDMQNEQCLILNLSDDVLVYEAMYYKTAKDEGLFAYSDDINDLKKLRVDLVKAKLFKPTDLTFTKIKNISAIMKQRRASVNV